MGREVNDWAWEQELPLGEKTVLLCLAQYAPDKDQSKPPMLKAGECTPGIDRIADECGCSKASVKRYREALVERGLIEVHRRSKGGRRTSDLTVIVGWLQGLTVSPSVPKPRAQSAQAKGSACTPQGLSVSPRSNKGNRKKNRKATTTARARPVAEVDGQEVTDAERDLAAVVVAEFEKQAGFEPFLIDAEGRATKELALIVGRIREEPELTGEDHRWIIECCFREPIWEGSAGSIATIYKAGQWPKARARAKGGKSESYERDLDDPRRARPAW